MNTNEEKKETVPPVVSPVTPTPPKMRQIVIETDGNSINLIKAEVSGKIELVGILQNLIAFVNQQK